MIHALSDLPVNGRGPLGERGRRSLPLFYQFQRRMENAKRKAEIDRRHGPDTGSAGGDSEQLRGLLAFGRGMAPAAIKGSDPVAALLAKERCGLPGERR